jgi:hypothetical protein
MPLPFRRKRQTAPVAPPPPQLAPDRLTSHDHSLRLQYHAKSGDGVRLVGEVSPSDLPSLMAGVAASEVELIEPLNPDVQGAAPSIVHPDQALLWINAHHRRSPIARHALLALESLDAIDTAYETLAVALLHGEVDAGGVPRFDAIVGGLITFWDEDSGDLIVRPVVTWGGDGARGDTDRIGQRLLARLTNNVLASQGAHGLHLAERPVAGGRRTCAHCGFPYLTPAAHYCPKCGMRQER